MSDTSEPQRLESALTRKVEAERLIEQVAHAVSPGSKPRPSGAGSDYGPSECTAPRTGQVYYTISRQFDAPSGKTGADLVPALRASFERHGFKTANQEDVGEFVRFLGETQYVGFNVLAYNTSRLVQINLDTECGSPEPSSPDTATAP
ncbi:MAG TPA: hypothetical protein VFT67_16895 [Jatrophihabitantaceae bacterium]|nr:hypothetical protein [Jatrophihabitantaceae bacterium]